MIGALHLLTPDGPPGYIRLPMNPAPQPRPYPSTVDGSTQGARAPNGPRGPDGSADADVELVRRMQAGDEQALGAFYDRWFPVVSGVVARILRLDGDVEDVIKVFQFIESEGPARGLVLNVKKSEIWWPSRASSDPFPAEVDRVDNAGVKLLGAPIGSREFTTEFVKKKLKALDVCKVLREVNDAQVEFGLFRGCLSYNKINPCCELVHLICCKMRWRGLMSTFKTWLPRFYGYLVSQKVNGNKLLCL